MSHLESFEPPLASSGLTRRRFLEGSAALGTMVALASCGVSSTSTSVPKKNPPNYRWAYWQALPLSADHQKQLVDLGRDPHALPHAEAIDLTTAVRIGTPAIALAENEALGFGFRISPTVVQVGILAASIKLGHGERNGMPLDEIYTRIGQEALMGTMALCQLRAGVTLDEQLKAGAQSFTPLPTIIIQASVPVDKMDFSIPLI